MDAPISHQLHNFIADTAKTLALSHLKIKPPARLLTTSEGETENLVAAAPDLHKNTLYLPLKPSGYPINQQMMDFGSGNPNATQIANASAFAQLVNQIPNSGESIWTASGRIVWNIWEMVLDAMQFPQGASTTQLSQFQSNLQLDKRLDMAGNVYYHTGYSPSQFWLTTGAQQWQSHAFTPNTGSSQVDVMKLSNQEGKENDLEFDASNMSLSSDMILVTILRPWWSPWIFDSPNWRYGPISLASPLSDGEQPPSGAMTMYANAFLVARNVKLNLDMSKPKNQPLAEKLEQADNVVWDAFQMKGHNHEADLPACATSLKATEKGIQSTGLQILGFNCNILPKCPNPNPNLSWPPLES